MSDDRAFNFRACEFLLLRATIRCPHCQRATRVQALALPPGHAAFSEPDKYGAGSWQTVPLPVVLFAIDCLDVATTQALKDREATLQPPARGEAGWRNRCEQCGHAIEEADLHEEAGAAFMPQSAGDAASLMLERVVQPVCAGAAGANIDPPWFDDFLRG